MDHALRESSSAVRGQFVYRPATVIAERVTHAASPTLVGRAIQVARVVENQVRVRIATIVVRRDVVEAVHNTFLIPSAGLRRQSVDNPASRPATIRRRAVEVASAIDEEAAHRIGAIRERSSEAVDHAIGETAGAVLCKFKNYSKASRAALFSGAV